MGPGGSTAQGSAGAPSFIPALILFALIGWAIARIAKKQGKSSGLYFILGMIPFVSIVALFVLGNREKLICPECGEKVLKGAKRCKHCGYYFVEGKVSESERIEEPKEEKKETRSVEKNKIVIDSAKEQKILRGMLEASSTARKCTCCGSLFYEPKGMRDKIDFNAMQRVRVGCRKCGTPVCFSCAATAADELGKAGNCFCPKCGQELGPKGEAGELGEYYSGWDQGKTNSKSNRKNDELFTAKINDLIFKLKDSNPSVRESSVREMISLGKPAVELLIQYLKHPDKWARLMAAAALGKMKEPGAIKPLEKALDDPDEGVKVMVQKALDELRRI